MRTAVTAVPKARRMMPASAPKTQTSVASAVTSDVAPDAADDVPPPVVGDITPVVRPAVGDEPSGISANSPSIASEILLIAPGVMLPTTRATGTALIPGKDAR